MKGQGKKIISLFLICVMMLGVAGPGMEIFAGTTGASVENTEKTVAEAEHDKAVGTAGNNRSFGIGDVAEDPNELDCGYSSTFLDTTFRAFLAGCSASTTDRKSVV